jgi:hypothetical protein
MQALSITIILIFDSGGNGGTDILCLPRSHSLKCDLDTNFH